MTYKIVPADKIPEAKNVDIDSDKELVECVELIYDMIEMCEKNTGIGLSAVQIGVPKRLCVARIAENWWNFINCEYEPIVEKGKRYNIEGCLSLPKQQYKVQRWNEVEVSGSSIMKIEPDSGEISIHRFKIEFSDYASIVVQHELDHQNGILIRDIGQRQ